jgi:hypothetical protein
MDLKPLLELSALILSLVNGLMLLRNYLRDRPRLSVTPVHPEFYQWLFNLTDDRSGGNKRFGFLAYVCIVNRGIRDVSLESWNLRVRTTDKRSVELKPISIPEPHVELGTSGNVKVYPVLGQIGAMHEGKTMIRSGDSISGFAFYIAENVLIGSGKAIAEILVSSVFGNRAKAQIHFREISREDARRMIENIDLIVP